MPTLPHARALRRGHAARRRFSQRGALQGFTTSHCVQILQESHTYYAHRAGLLPMARCFSVSLASYSASGRVALPSESLVNGFSEYCSRESRDDDIVLDDL